MSTSQQIRRSAGRQDSRRWNFVSAFGALLVVTLFLPSGLSSTAIAQSQPASAAAPVSTSSASSAPTPAQAVSPPTQTPATTAELNSRDEATTFKVNVRLVLVRVVARDAQGHAVGNLHKEDFQLFDNRKPQVITQFSMEQPGEQMALARKRSEPAPGEAPAATVNAADVPERFIALVFDDVHLQFGNLAQARAAAERHLATLQPTDRVAIFSTSGQTTLDFTDDRAQLRAALEKLQPRPVAGNPVAGCPNVDYYMGDLIQNKHDTQAILVATQDAINCFFGGPSSGPTQAAQQQQAQRMAMTAATEALMAGEEESRVALRSLKDIVRRVAQMPGQRNVVLVSPGFLTPELETEYMDVIDRAVRSQVIINALDARGLYAIVPGGDISNGGFAGGAFAGGLKLQYQTASAAAVSDVMAVLADGTGGTFFQGNNDLDDGFRRVSAAPEYYYVLGFSPQNLKLDGSLHNLKVTLKSATKLTVQARRGYYAPKHATDATQVAKEEIEDAVFSQEEMHDLPVGLHTQFFKSGDASAKLTVLAHVDVKQLRFRKAEGRNWNDLTVVSALFDRNGNLLQGTQKTVEMRLKDETLQAKVGSGITLKTSFDVKPGSYLVRLVVRDKEGQLMSAENGAVEIP